MPETVCLERDAFLVWPRVQNESRYIENHSYLSRYTHERAVLQRESEERLNAEFTAEWLRSVKEDLPRFIPFLTGRCGIDFRGRILEIGAGAAWLGAELSKLPGVVEMVVTDYSPRLLKEQAPKIFQALKANHAKIVRMPVDFHKLDFPANYFNAVVCSSALHQAANLIQLLREVKRVLKPGGKFVAIREPVWSTLSPRARAKARARLAQAGVFDPFYTLSDYKEFFLQAGFPMEVKEANLRRGLRDYLDKLVKGVTYARYAFVGTKPSRP